jgi:Tol biopolymer transport system component
VTTEEAVMRPNNEKVTIGRLVLPLVAAVALAGGSLPAAAGGPTTLLVSRTSGGDPANGDSFTSSVSATGRFVAFESDSTNLPGSDTYNDVYVRDRRNGRTTLVSKTSGGEPADGNSYAATISASGRFVAFHSYASNLPGGSVSYKEVYVHDRATRRTMLASKTSGGDPAAGGDSDWPSISASGRFVAFESDADNLPGAATFDEHVYVHDRATRRTRLVSKTSAGDPADGLSSEPSISSSGRFVAFESNADNLPGDDAYTDAYVHDREAGRTRLVSKTSGGDPADGDSFATSVSSTGRFVAFESSADNLPGDDAYRDVHVHDVATGRTSLVSKTSGGNPATGGDSEDPSISSTGRFVAFYSNATNLPGHDAYSDVYVRDRGTGRTKVVSVRPAGNPALGDSYYPAISPPGRFVAFESDADNLPGRNGNWDIYLRGPLT